MSRLLRYWGLQYLALVLALAGLFALRAGDVRRRLDRRAPGPAAEDHRGLPLGCRPPPAAGTTPLASCWAATNASTNGRRQDERDPGDHSAAGGVDPDRAVVTAGARHCQRAAADYLHGRGAGFILPAKDNQPRLSGALDALPWRDVPSPAPPPAAATAGSKPAPSSSWTRPATCRSRTSARPT